MARILISILLHPAGTLGDFLATTIAGLEARGHQVTLWSPGPLRSGTAHPDLVLLPWPLHKAVAALQARGVSPRAAEGVIDDAKWCARLETTGYQGTRRDEAEALCRSYRDFCAGFLCDLRPDLFLAWNPLTVHVGVPADLCRAWGIPVLAIERGVPPDTLILEHGALLGGADLTGKTLEDLIPEEAFDGFAARGQAHMDRYPLDSMLRYDPGAPPPAPGEGRSGRLRIAVLGTDDCSTGMIPDDHPDRLANFPLIRSSHDAAVAVAQALPEAEVLVKSHPSVLHLTADWTLPPNARLVDTAPDALLRESDVAVNLGGSLGALALRLGKPVVSLARDVHSGKGITFDPPDRDSLAATITAAAAATPEDTARRLTRYHALCGKAMEETLFAYPPGPDGAPDTGPLLDRLEAMAPGVPAGAWPDLPPATDPAFTPGRAATGQAVQVLDGIGDRDLLLDFDHTLFADNSTEAYLRAARPAALVSILLAVVRGLPPWHKIGGRHWFRLRDLVTVAVISLLLPWNILRWRRIAPAIFREKSTHPVAVAAARVPAAQTVIISFGFDFIIRGLLRGSHWEGARRIATPMPPPLRPVFQTLRKGKKALAEGLFSPRRIATAVLLTDSEDDRDLLDRVGVPLLIDPVGTFRPAEVGLYLPLRYTADAKYNAGYLRTMSFLIEIPLMALAFLTAVPFGAGMVAGFLALYLSVQCIYEIGYFDNDQRAALREKNPTLKPRAQLWSGFPLERHAWIWGTLSGALGCFLVAGADGFPRAFAAWMAGMVALRMLFRFYNDRGEWLRTLLYPALPLLKVFSPALVMPVALVGALGLQAHVIAMWSTYIVYRAGGNKFFFYRDDMRIAAYVLVCLTMAVAGALAPTPQNAVLFGAGLILVLFQRFMVPLRRRIVRGLRRVLRR